MCPFCLASMGLIVAGSASTGGLALAMKLSRKNNGAGEIAPTSNERRNPDVNEHDHQPENSIA